MMTPARLIAVPATLLVLSLAGSAAGQNALGDGHALDANPATTSGGINTSVGGTDFRSRNNVVTNTVIGGRGFRESVGYTASDAFRGEAGSDDLFEFRADSAWSGVNLVNYNSTYQRFRYGQDAGLIQYSRVGQGSTSESVNSVYRPTQINEARRRLDQLSFASLTTNSEENRVQPTLVGNMVDRDGQPVMVRVSALGGIEKTPANQVGELIGLTVYDFVRVAEEIDPDMQRRLGRAYEGSYGELLADGRIDVSPSDTRLSPLGLGSIGEDQPDEDDPEVVDDGRVTGDSELLAIRARVAQRYTRFGEQGVVTSSAQADLDEQAVAEIEEDLRMLRVYLTGNAGEEGEAHDPDDDTLPRRGIGIDSGSDLPATATLDDLDPDKPLTDRANEPLVGNRTVADFGLILRHGEQIDRLNTGEENTRFAELLESAEQALREGRYFWAERRFSRALRYTPGHPLATTGLIHTQIGAGLYLSGALTLRSLYQHQPEMIDARFAANLLPNRPRLLDAIETLGRRLENQERDRSNAALMYAYIGRLLDERETIERGIDVMTEDAPDDPLTPLLRAIWLGTDALE